MMLGREYDMTQLDDSYDRFNLEVLWKGFPAAGRGAEEQKRESSAVVEYCRFNLEVLLERRGEV